MTALLDLRAALSDLLGDYLGTYTLANGATTPAIAVRAIGEARKTGTTVSGMELIIERDPDTIQVQTQGQSPSVLEWTVWLVSWDESSLAAPAARLVAAFPNVEAEPVRVPEGSGPSNQIRVSLQIGHTLVVSGPPSGVTVTGTSSAALVILGSAAGFVGTVSIGTSSGTLITTGSAAGVVTVTAVSSQSLAFGGSASGGVRVGGASSQTLAITGTAAGLVGAGASTTGSSSATLDLMGTAAGAVRVAGASSQVLAITGTAAGAVRVTGSTAQTLAITGTAAGVIGAVAIGNSSATLAITGTAAGTVRVAGASAQSLAITGTAVGTVRVTGSTSQAFAITGTAAGTVRVTGSTSQTLVITGTSAGVVQEVIVAENARTGVADSTVGVSTIGRGTDGFLGYAKQFSTDAGNSVSFAVDGVNAANIAIHRIGHYAGNRWRLVATISNTGTNQPDVQTLANSNGSTSASNWSTTATWSIPADAVSGLYVGVVRDSGNTAQAWIPFIVRNDSRTADIVIRVSDTTWGAAYNPHGTKASPFNGKTVYGEGVGASVYDINARGVQMSYDRPVVSRPVTAGAEFVNTWDNYESALIDWVEKNGFNVKYISCYDLDQGLTAVGSAKVLLNAGHDEYWSDGMLNNTEAFIDGGGHAVSMSANTQFWRIRWADAGRTFWCYKDTMPGPAGLRTGGAGTALDPVSWTGTWRDTRWVSRRPENLLLAGTFRMNGIRDETMVINGAANQAKPFWRNTTVASGTNLTVTQIIGFEADSLDFPNTGGVNLGTTDVNINGSYADNNGENYTGNGTLNWGIACHYPRLGSTAGLAFSFCTNQWMWGLSNYHRRGSAVNNREMRQATYNLLTDLGSTAATKESDLTTVTPVALSTYGAVKVNTGSSIQGLAITGTAAGTIRVTGTSAQTLAITGSATGAVRVTGSSAQTLTITGTAGGSIGGGRVGASSVTLTITGTAAGVTAPLWTPADLTTTLWLDAGDAATVVLNGSDVSSWQDKKTPATALAQASASLQPRYDATGKYVEVLQGEFLWTDSSPIGWTPLATQVNVFAVLAPQPVTPASNGTYGRILSIGDADVSTAPFQYIWRSETSDALTGGVVALASYADGMGSYLPTGSYNFATQYIVVQSQNNGNMWSEAGSSPAMATFTSSGLPSGISRLRLGFPANAFGVEAAFRIKELVGVGNIGTTDQEKLFGYLAHKHNAADRLPGGHPYKLVPPTKLIGASSQTLAITGSSTATVRVTGSSSQTLAITRTAAATIRVTGSSSQTLAITGSATGTVTSGGSGTFLSISNEYSSGATNVGSGTVTLATVNTGDLIIALVQRVEQNNCTGVTVGGSAMTLVRRNYWTGESFGLDVWARIATASGTSVAVTATYSVFKNFMTMTAARYSGVSSATALATSCNGASCDIVASTSTDYQAQAITIGSSGLLIATGTNYDNARTHTAASGWTKRLDGSGTPRTSFQFLFDQNVASGTYGGATAFSTAATDRYFSILMAFPLS
jgi:hypothetical protein